jgi:recombinase
MRNLCPVDVLGVALVSPGYRSVDVMTDQRDGSGRPIRSHVTCEIDPEQAGLFARSLSDTGGHGFMKIADALNRKGAPTPRAKPGRIVGWDVSSVRAVLLQPLYRGVARWNRLRQHDDEGNPIFENNRETEHVLFVTKRGGSFRRILQTRLIGGLRRTRRTGAVSTGTRRRMLRRNTCSLAGSRICPFPLRQKSRA